jgi:L-asparaginase
LFKVVKKVGRGINFLNYQSGSRIRVIITGGTFDKHYDELEGKLTFNDTHLPDILKDGRCKLPITLELNQLIDSLKMREADRVKILGACRRAVEEHLIITHGTDTMVETAVVLGRANLAKTIILTGAMIPYMLRQSDAAFNFAASIVAVQLLPNGVYVCMNGSIFPWNDVRKNKRQGQFENIK